MATASVPSGTILAVLTEMFTFIKWNKSDAKAFMIYFLTFTRKIAKPWFAISLENWEEEKKKTRLPALKIFPMLGETNNQFYMALMEENIILRQILKFKDWLTNEILNNKYSEPLYLWYIL